MRNARVIAGLAVAVIVLLASASMAFALPEMPAENFEPSDNCGCHSAFLESWRKSMHAKALEDPIYQHELELANKATDGALGPFCEGCHAPVAVMAGMVGADPAQMPPQASDAVSCDFCHQVTGTTDPIGNTSNVVAGDGVKRAQFEDSNSPYHPSEGSEFHETAEFCGACHNVNHPVNGLALEATYTEWKEGPYAAEGTVCQDCHMTPGPGVTKPYAGTAAAGGPQREHIYIMTFAGGNVALGDAVLAEERLKAAAEVELVAPDIVAPGETVDVQTTITNVGAGHYLPTGLTEVRMMWLEVTATEPGEEPEVLGDHMFQTVLGDDEGNAPVPLWEATNIASDDRIPPKESVSDTFQFTMPEGGEVELAATLYYRSASEEVAEASHVEIPTTTMASSVMGVFGSEDTRADAATGEDADEGGSNPSMLIGIVLAVVAVGILVYIFLRSRKSGGDDSAAA